MNLKKIIYYYFLLLPFIDLATSLLSKFGNFPLSIGMIVKGITILYSIYYVIFKSKCKYRDISIKFIGLIFIYFVLFFALKLDSLTFSSIIIEVKYALKYFYFPIMLFGILNIFNDLKIDNNYINKLLSINCFIYVLLLLIPYFTGTSFNSYSYDSVFGKKGWFYSANEIGVIMVILLSSSFILTKKNKFINILFLLPIIYSISLIGTKVSYLGMIIVIILLAIFNLIGLKQNKNKVKPIVFSSLLLLCLVIGLSFSKADDNLQNAIERNEHEETASEMIDFPDSPIGDVLNQKEIRNIITLILNGRENFFITNIKTFNNSNMAYKLFGLGWHNIDNINYTYEKKLIEIDYLDIFVHYGILGFILYFTPLIYFVLNFLKNIKFANKESSFYFLISMMILGISCLAGHILSAPAVSIYLVLLIIMVINSSVRKVNDKEITIMALHLGYGGIEQYISSLCKMLKDRYKINIISTYKIYDNPPFEFDENIKISYLINDSPKVDNFKKLVKDKKIIKSFVEFVRLIKIFILKYYRNIKAIRKINSKYIITTRTFHNKLVGLYGNINSVKIATEHNPFDINNKKYNIRLVKSIRYFDYFVVVSKELEEGYKKYNLKPKCVYIPNVIDELPELNGPKENIIVNIGRLEKIKDQSTLIDVINIVKQNINDIKLYIIGDGSLKEELNNKIAKLNLTDNVKLLGYLNKNEIDKYMQKAKVFALSSHDESFGLVLIEAMSYKIPCVAFDSASGARIILNNNAGILVKNRDINVMAKEIVKLLKDEKYNLKIGNTGYKKCQKYLAKNVKKQWFNLLKRGMIN